MFYFFVTSALTYTAPKICNDRTMPVYNISQPLEDGKEPEIDFVWLPWGWKHKSGTTTDIFT